MLKVKYKIIDGCNYSRSDKIHEYNFKNKKDLDAYIDSMNRAMYEIDVIEIEKI